MAAKEALEQLENRLWSAADQLRANSGLTSQQYAQPVLGLIFLRFAEARFSTLRSKLKKKAAGSRRGRFRSVSDEVRPGRDPGRCPGRALCGGRAHCRPT